MAAPWPCWPAARSAVSAGLLGVLWLVSVATGTRGAAAVGGEETLKCEDLKVGQYPLRGALPLGGEVELVGVAVLCFPAPNITCKNLSGNETHFTGKEVGFFKPISCRNVNGYSYKVAVALSLFLGWLGADRFYLGYPALGLLKFCTVGFCGIGSLIDFILISMQIVGPSDGSSYIIDYYGTRLIRLSITNETFRKTQLYP
ncbi:TM2 domain-containing protein 1 isoform X2 [Carlito syrichta]|uniref:TM2 domain-containing protein 1 isoform X2 n=1 Tax=Carlito syrichta TaxID=1868482 RepID=A0A3Q0EAV1_CARSF|nr:TM2 domain-containing protein 1 isoform X2 [Carlito syrichta]